MSNESSEIRELTIDEIESVSGGAFYNRNSPDAALAVAKDSKNGSIFTGNSSKQDTLDNNSNLP